jgi:O-antigen/teichoic acid export membrane protein
MSVHAGSKRKTVQNFFSSSLVQIGNYVLPMITLPIISRIIGPEKYGAVNYAFAFVSYFILFINAGFDLYGTRMIVSFKEDKQKIQKLFSRITFAKLYISLFTTIIFAICLFSIDQLKDEKLISIFTYLLCVGWIINPSWLYNGMQDSRRYAMFSFVSKLLFSIAVVMVVREKSDYIYHPLITSIAHILVSYISFQFALKKYKLKLGWVNIRDIIQTLKENRHLSLIWWISNQSSSTCIIIAGFLLTTTDVGFYAAALRIIIIIQSIVSMPLNTVLFPYIGEAFVNSYDAGIKRINKTFPYLVILAFVIAVGAFIISGPLILLFFGSEFAEAVLLLKISAVALFFATVNSALGQQVMLNLKKDAAYVRFLVFNFFINAIFLVTFIKLYGVMGAAIAWPCSEIILFISYLIYFKHQKIQVIDYAYYHPKFIFGNVVKLVKFNVIKKPAIQ